MYGFYMTYPPGERVVCVDDVGSVHLVKGKIYIVASIIHSDPKLMNIEDGIIGYSKARFIPENASRLEKLICGFKDE